MKYTLLAAACLCGYLGYSQVYKFKAFQTAIAGPNQNDEIKWNSSDILTVINLDKSKVNIYAKETVDMDLISDGRTRKDDEKNLYIDYDAVDQKGVKCTIEIVIFDDQIGRHKATLIIEYEDAHIIYRLKNTDE